MAKTVFTPEYRILLRMLREHRTVAGLTQVELAKRLRQTQSFVSKIERGEARLDLVQLRQICRILGTSLPAFVQEYERRLAAGK
jgi:transcriptional regulator with XRE-family HTH domain